MSDAVLPLSPARRGAAWPQTLLWALPICALAYLPVLLTQRSLFGVRLSNWQLLNLGLAQINVALIMMLGAISLTFLTGCAGLISIGHGAFYAVGALAGAMAASQLQLPFVLVLPIAAAAGALVGVLAGLPSLRVRGLYFVLSTLAVHYIVIYFLDSYQQTFFDVVGIPFPEVVIAGFVIESQMHWYYLLLAILVLTYLLLRNFLDSRQGVAMQAMRDNELAASAAGVQVSVIRLRAFAISSAITAVAGALYAYYLTSVNAEFFSIGFAIQFIAMIIIGGMGSLGGAIVGAAVWLLVPLVLTGMVTELSPPGTLVHKLVTESKSQWVNLVFGLGVVLLLIHAPEGIAGSLRRAKLRWLARGTRP